MTEGLLSRRARVGWDATDWKVNEGIGRTLAAHQGFLLPVEGFVSLTEEDCTGSLPDNLRCILRVWNKKNHWQLGYHVHPDIPLKNALWSLWPVLSLWPLVIHACVHLSVFVASCPSSKLWLLPSQSFHWLWSLFFLSLFAVSQTIQYQCSIPLLSKCCASSIVSLLICLGEKVTEFSIPSLIHSFLHLYLAPWAFVITLDAEDKCVTWGPACHPAVQLV